MPQGVLWVVDMYRSGRCGDYWFTYECFAPAVEAMLAVIAEQAAQPPAPPPRTPVSCPTPNAPLCGLRAAVTSKMPLTLPYDVQVTDSVKLHEERKSQSY